MQCQITKILLPYNQLLCLKFEKVELKWTPLTTTTSTATTSTTTTTLTTDAPADDDFRRSCCSGKKSSTETSEADFFRIFAFFRGLLWTTFRFCTCRCRCRRCRCVSPSGPFQVDSSPTIFSFFLSFNLNLNFFLFFFPVMRGFEREKR